jgi:2-polyprenyl-3-methyl-5-hydroxy-6-metoxy-1,4-benzoquinol methylase
MEINTGYLKTASRNPPQKSEHSEATRNNIFQEARKKLIGKIVRHRLFFWVQVLLLFLAGFGLSAGLVLWKLVYGRPLNSLHKKALRNIDLFLEQYPMGLYGLLCKSFELAFLGDIVKSDIEKLKKSVIEVAIGEGSFSRRIFRRKKSVVGLDITPDSLFHTTRMAHVRQSIVSDCLELPIEPGTFGFLVANNLLHHISNKRKVLEQFSQIAEFVLYNENTPAWTGNQTMPFFLRTVGFKEKATAKVKELNQRYLQDLWPLSKCDHEFERHFLKLERESFLNERTYAAAFLFSAIFRGTAPVEPEVKAILLSSPFKALTLWLTKHLAELLIAYDFCQERKDDVFVSYYGKSKKFKKTKTSNYLRCPECKKGSLKKSLQCGICGASYQKTDGMIFLLEKKNNDVAVNYSIRRGEIKVAEHL